MREKLKKFMEKELSEPGKLIMCIVFIVFVIIFIVSTFTNNPLFKL